MTAGDHDAVTIDRAAVDAFWRRCISSGAVDTDQPVPGGIFWFGDRRPHGRRARRAGEPLPHVGQLAVVDGSGRPRALIRTVEVRIGPLSSVDDEFAGDEGEGDRTRADWLRRHEACFRRYVPTIGVEFSDDLPTVFEGFEVLAAE